MITDINARAIASFEDTQRPQITPDMGLINRLRDGTYPESTRGEAAARLTQLLEEVNLLKGLCSSSAAELAALRASCPAPRDSGISMRTADYREYAAWFAQHIAGTRGRREGDGEVNVGVIWDAWEEALSAKESEGWLIEDQDQSPMPRWIRLWDVGGEIRQTWTTNAHEALRFGRKEDATLFARYLMITPHMEPLPLLKITDHIWLDARPTPGPVASHRVTGIEQRVIALRDALREWQLEFPRIPLDVSLLLRDVDAILVNQEEPWKPEVAVVKVVP